MHQKIHYFQKTNMFHVLDQITVPLSLGYMSKIWAKSSVTYRKNDRLHTENVDFHISEKYLDLKCKFWVHRPCVVWALSCSWQSLQALWAYLMEGKMTKISQVLKLQLFSMYTAIGSARYRLGSSHWHQEMSTGGSGIRFVQNNMSKELQSVPGFCLM